MQPRLTRNLWSSLLSAPWSSTVLGLAWCPTVPGTLTEQQHLPGGPACVAVTTVQLVLFRSHSELQVWKQAWNRLLLQSQTAPNERSSYLRFPSAVIPTMRHPAQATCRAWQPVTLGWPGGLAGKGTCLRTDVPSLTPGGRRQAPRSRPLTSVHVHYMCACQHTQRKGRASGPQRPQQAAISSLVIQTQRLGSPRLVPGPHWALSLDLSLL